VRNSGLRGLVPSTLLALLLLGLLAAAAAGQQPGQELQPVRGTIVELGPGSIQVQDQVGMTYTIALDSQTVICHFTQPRRGAVPSPFSELRKGDTVVARLLPPTGGVFVASKLGFWHEGETPRAEWFAESTPTPAPAATPAYTTPVTDTEKALPGKGQGAKGQPPKPGPAKIADPGGHYSLDLLEGWEAMESPQGLQFFTKQGEKKFMFFAACSVSLPPEYVQADIMTIAQAKAQELAAQMKNLNFQLLKVAPVTAGQAKGAVLSYAYKYINGVAAVDEDYYFKIGQSGVILHFESRPEMFESFRKDIQHILQSLKVR